MSGDPDELTPTIEQTMREIRALFAEMHATNQLILERVTKLAELRGVNLPSVSGRTLG